MAHIKKCLLLLLYEVWLLFVWSHFSTPKIFLPDFFFSCSLETVSDRSVFVLSVMVTNIYGAFGLC